MQKTKHDELRDEIVLAYRSFGTVPCQWCEEVVSLPVEGTAVAEYNHQISNIAIRSDVAICDSDSNPMIFIEIIDSNPPRDDVLNAYAHSDISTIFIAIGRGTSRYEASERRRILQSTGNDREVYCSTFCWIHREEERLSCLKTCVCCDTLDFTSGSYYDWDGNVYDAFCIRCAASQGGQFSGPMSESDMFTADNTLPTRFLKWNLSRFWRMVWNKRAAKAESNKKCRDESRTARQLDRVHEAFNMGNWRRGAELLMPIGSGWTPGDRGESAEPLYAWSPDNCLRTSEAWDRLFCHLLSRLPIEVRGIVKQRMDHPEAARCFGCGRKFTNTEYSAGVAADWGVTPLDRMEFPDGGTLYECRACHRKWGRGSPAGEFGTPCRHAE